MLNLVAYPKQKRRARPHMRGMSMSERRHCGSGFVDCFQPAIVALEYTIVTEMRSKNPSTLSRSSGKSSTVFTHS